MLTQCATCSSLMSSHAYESHRYVHDSTDRSFMCERGCMEMFFETADELEMHKLFMHVSLTEHTNNIEDRASSTKITDKQSSSSDKPNRYNATMTSSSAAHDCDICSQSIPTTHMTSHMWSHSPIGRPFQCKHGCIKTYFAYESDRAVHYQGVHNIDKDRKSKYGKSNCKVCYKYIQNLNMDLHLRTHDRTEQPFECLRGCEHLYFETQGLLDLHTEERHKKGRHPTQRNYPLSDDLLDLIKKATAATTTTCPVCDESMCCTSIGQHMTTHPQNDSRPFKCLHGCVDTFFNTENEFDVHRQEIHGIHPETHWPSCRICGQTTIDRYVMRRHIEKHDPTDRPFQCVDGCVNLYFPTAYTLTVHRRKTHNLDPTNWERCKICGRTCKMPKHMAEHSSEGRLFKCVDECAEMYFATTQQLQTHQRQHQWRHRIRHMVVEATSPSLIDVISSTSTPTSVASQPSNESAVKTQSNALCSISNTPIVDVKVEHADDMSPSTKRTRLRDHYSKKV